MVQRLIRRLRPRSAIIVGYVTSSTGLMANWGRMNAQGLELGIEYATGGTWEIFDRPIRLKFEDDQGDPEVGRQKAETLIDQGGANLLAGCVSSSIAIQVSRVAQERGVVYLVDPAATDVLTGEWGHRYIFRVAPNVSQDAAAGGRYAVEYLGKRFCFLSPDYVLGHQSRSAWRRVVREYGGETVGDILAPPDETDFQPYLEEALAAHPDVLMPTWAGVTLKTLFAQMREMGIFGRMKVLSNLVDRDSLRVLGKTAKGMVGAARYHYAFPENPVNDWFVRQHQERFDAPPDIFTGTGFGTGIALVEGLKRTGGNPDAEELIPVMEGMSFEGPKGTYTLRPEDHQALQPMYVVEMVEHPQEPRCIPRLIQEVSAQASAPPIVSPRVQTE